MRVLKLLSLVCTFFLLAALKAEANSFSDLYLTVTLDNTEKKEIPEQIPLIDLTESGQESTFLLHGFSVRTAEAAKSVAMQYRVYKSGVSATSWTDCNATADYDGTGWNYSADIDVLNGLEQGGTYILEFRMKGIDVADNEFYYNNGGANYQLKFAVGKPWSVRFKPGLNAAVMQLQSDGPVNRYMFPSEQTWGGTELGTVSNLHLKAFGISVECSAADASISSVRMAYKFYALGSSEKSWYYFDAEHTDGTTERTYTNFEDIDLMAVANERILGGLQNGQTYVFEMRFEMKAGDKEYQLSDSEGGFKFIFTYREDNPIGGQGFKSVGMQLLANMQEIKLQLGAEGIDVLDLAKDGQSNWELTIEELEIETNEPANYVAMNYRIYEEGKEPGADWNMLDANSNGWNNYEWHCYKELNLLSGLEKGKTYIAECYFWGVNENGSPFEYNNGGKNYKIRFTVTPESPDFRDLQLLVSIDGEEMPVNIPASGMPIADLTEGDEQNTTWELALNSWTVKTVETATSVAIMSRIYKSTAAAGGWLELNASSTDGINWICTLPINATDGLEKNETYIWEFYVKATNAKGNIFYNNGGENYKIKFCYGDEKQDNVKFVSYNGESSFVTLETDGFSPYTYYLPGIKNMAAYKNGAFQMGTVSSLSLKQFVAYIQCTNVEIKSVSLQYKLYEQGSNGNWNIIDAEGVHDLDDDFTIKRYLSYTPHPFNALENGKDYILEVMLQAEDSDGKYYFLTNEGSGGSSTGFKFAFTYQGAAPVSKGKFDVCSFRLEYNDNSQPFVTTEELSNQKHYELGPLHLFALPGYWANFMFNEGDETSQLTEAGLLYSIVDDSYNPYPSVWEMMASYEMYGAFDNHGPQWIFRNMQPEHRVDLLNGLVEGRHYMLYLKFAAKDDNDTWYYLPDEYSEPYSFGFIYIPDASGVAGITVDGKKAATIYDLTGKKAATNYRGITIEEGKKILRK